MAVDYFLKLDGIQGESADEKHKDEIQLMSFSWGGSPDLLGCRDRRVGRRQGRPFGLQCHGQF